MLLPEELNLPRLPGPLQRWEGGKLWRLPESTLLTEAELSCENAPTSFSAASVPRVTFSAASKVCSSVSSFFCVSLLWRPQTKRSRKASLRWVLNWQVEARCFRLAANAVTLSPSHCVQLWNRYLLAITSFLGVNWFFTIVVSCAYVFSEGGIGTSPRYLLSMCSPIGLRF